MDATDNKAFKKAMISENERRKMDFLDYICKEGRADLTEKLVKLRKNAIALKLVETDDNEIPVGTSKSGGYPDLPPTILYPTLSEYTVQWEFGPKKGKTEHYKESSMQLVTQLNLSETAEYDKDNLLPKTGMLYIFWSGELMLNDCKYCKYKFSGKNTNVYKVIYYDGDLSQLKRTAPPCPYYSKSFETVLKSYLIQPDYCKYDYYVEDEIDLYYNARDDFNVNNCSKLLGYQTGSMNVDEPAEGWTNLFEFNYHSGCIWGLNWFVNKKSLSERTFNDIYFTWDID